MVKNPLAMQETQEMQVWSLGPEDPLEEGMATHSSILAWRFPWTEDPGGLQSRGLQRVRHDQAHTWWVTKTSYCCYDKVLLLRKSRGFPGDASGKEPACQCWRHETWVQSLGQEDPLEEGMATHSSILAWRIPCTEEPGELQSMGLPRIRHDWSDLACTCS